MKRAQRAQAAEQARLRGEEKVGEVRDGLGRRSLLVVAGEPTDTAAGDDALAGERRDVCCVPDPDVEEDLLCSADRCGHQRENDAQVEGYTVLPRVPGLLDVRRRTHQEHVRGLSPRGVHARWTAARR